MSEEVQQRVEEIEDLLEEGDLEAAETAIDSAIDTLGPVNELLLLRAEVALEQEEFALCIAGIDGALKELEDQETRGQLLSSKGYAHFYLNELEEARGAFNEAVRLTEGQWSALIGRAMVHEELRYFRATLLDVDRLIATDDQEGQPFAIRGSIQMAYGNLEEARKDFERAVELDQEDEESRLQLARLLAVAKLTAEAMEVLEYLVDKGEDPDMVVPGALLRSQLSLTLGSTEAASEDAQKAINLQPELPWGYLQLAACHLTALNAGDAITALKHAEERVSDLRDAPDIHVLRASAYEQLDKPGKAAESRQNAEGSARLPAFVYGDVLNPARNVPLNPNKPVDVRALITQLFGSAEKAPPGYEDAVRNVIDKIPELVQQNPGANQLRIQLPMVKGMTSAPSLVIQVNSNGGPPKNA